MRCAAVGESRKWRGFVDGQGGGTSKVVRQPMDQQRDADSTAKRLAVYNAGTPMLDLVRGLSNPHFTVPRARERKSPPAFLLLTIESVVPLIETLYSNTPYRSLNIIPQDAQLLSRLGKAAPPSTLIQIIAEKGALGSLPMSTMCLGAIDIQVYPHKYSQ
ncbi:uncharacterized protein BCR38DRAFT_479775 [Pseudomassariella vexata]|uniref:Uncharacterized protein n=1 Tax=Pseudomassariella vexata TaxID=1141098 RepID=A0A1Y2EJ53_9PEZI|nr:uncharacterized protein BCR38DRAFT_479775 [Pseudomassariella vexata]ORY71266.1 hypothetical protein BCR38DRAFT_479775 [Pseudomassariella vexata]